MHLFRGQRLLDVTSGVVGVRGVDDASPPTRLTIGIDVESPRQPHDAGWVFKGAISVSVIKESSLQRFPVVYWDRLIKNPVVMD